MPKIRSKSITIRAVVIGLILIPINCYWVMVTETVWYALHITCISIFFNVIFCLFVITTINLLFIKYMPDFALNRGELLVIYIMLSSATAIGGQDFMQLLPPVCTHEFFFATVENEWKELFFRYIPSWLSVRDKGILRDYFEGGSTLYTVKHLKAWLKPAFAWGSFTLVLIFVMLCINTILRRQWVEKEKLAYPLIQLPLEMTDGKSAFFKNRLMWIGFSIAGGIDVLNGLHFLFPNLPYLHVKFFDIAPFFTEKPWNAMGRTLLSAYPFQIGLAYLIPLSLSFSCWFFYLFIKAEKILGVAIGLNQSSLHVGEQSSGAWLFLCVVTLVISRKYLWNAFLSALRGEKKDYRYAILGLIGGLLFLFFFCNKAGMSIWAIIVFFVIYFALSIAITRVRAELGPSTTEMYFTNPQRIMVQTLGTRRLKAHNLTIISLMYWFNRCNRDNPMPHQMEGFKIGQITEMDYGKLFLVIIIASFLGIFASFWSLLDLLFRHGAASGTYGFQLGMGWETFNRLQNWLSYPTETSYSAILAMGAGAFFTAFIYIMHFRFLWFPFHPVGYVLATSYPAVDYIWFSLFISWAIKWVILKQGGLKLYRKGMPFFMGLILGEFAVGSIWSIIGAVGSMPIYRIWIW